MSLIKQWEKECSDKLVGKTIKEVRYMSEKERNEHMWDKKALVIFFTDGTYIYPSADNEGNNAGSLFTPFDGLDVIPSI